MTKVIEQIKAKEIERGKEKEIYLSLGLEGLKIIG